MQSTTIMEDFQVLEAIDTLGLDSFEAWKAVRAFAKYYDGQGPALRSNGQLFPRTDLRSLGLEVTMGFDCMHEHQPVMAVAHLRHSQRWTAVLSMAAAHGCTLAPSTRAFLASL